MRGLLLAIMVLMALPRDAQAAPTMPLGVPDPGAWAWTSAPPFTHYVEPTNAASTDTNNPSGTPEKPRKTIPLALPAGSVVEIHGNYGKKHDGQGQEIKFNCTEAQPCFIRGQDQATRPTLTTRLTVYGHYGIVENLKFALAEGQNYQGQFNIWPMSASESVDHIVLRESELIGNLNGGGAIIKTNNNQQPSTNSDIVFFHNHIHHCGGSTASPDQDMHAIMVNTRVFRMWVLDNEMDYCSGDAIQINAGPNGQQYIHHIYVGRNHAHHLRQDAFWSKEASDVIFSENTAHDIIDSKYSVGGCLGNQYAPDFVWYLFNHCYATVNAYRNSTSADGGQAAGRSHNVFVIGNLFHNIHRTTRNEDGSIPTVPTVAAGNAFFLTPDSPGERHFVNNTIYNVDGGLIDSTASPSPALSPTVILKNNILGRVNSTGGNFHVRLTSSNVTTLSSMLNNLFFPNTGEVRILWGSNTVYNFDTFTAAFPTKCVGCLQGDPLFEGASDAGPIWQNINGYRSSVNGALEANYITFSDPSQQNYRMKAGSAALNAGAAAEEYQTFKDRYGIDIAYDLDKRARMSDGKIDIGAYEYASSTPPQPSACTGTGPITVSWKTVAGAESYSLETSIDTGESWQPAGNFPAPPATIVVAQDTLVLIRVGAVTGEVTTWNTSRGGWFSCPWQTVPGAVSVNEEERQ